MDYTNPLYHWDFSTRWVEKESEIALFFDLALCLLYMCISEPLKKMRLRLWPCKKVQVGKDQEKAQSEKASQSKNRGGKKLN